MIKIEQTEFWHESAGMPGVSPAANRAAMTQADSHSVGGERFEAEFTVEEIPEEAAAGMTEEDSPLVALEVSTPVESLVDEAAGDLGAPGLPQVEIEDPLNTLAAPADEVALAELEAPPPSRIRTGIRNSLYALRESFGPRFNMARFLRLTGSLDPLEDQDRWYQLPRRAFRPRLDLNVKRQISKDFLKDLRMPPRSYTINHNQRPAGWLKV
jgi:hypothetical protein